MRGSTVDTCTHVSPEGLGTMTIVFYLKVGLGSEVDSPGNRDILRAHRFWQAARCEISRSLFKKAAYRFVVASDTPSATAIFRVTMRSMAKRSSADRTMLGEGSKTLVIREKCGLWCVDISSSRSCASVCNIEKMC